MPVPADQLDAAAAGPAPTADELLGAGERGRRAGELWHTSGEAPRCPFPAGSLLAWVWLRWAVHARLRAAGMPE